MRGLLLICWEGVEDGTIFCRAKGLELGSFGGFDNCAKISISQCNVDDGDLFICLGVCGLRASTDGDSVSIHQ